eukprot:TRINITY_DN3336_c0_g6_i1.p2 TRINITY_DN3336_c0_g6~~TRINITY_DN3336_c0_g6_i1.p2  ORF type:complete len:363 (+),score=120.99 TRINITY_DN3336_c0_g6_i1:81-1091(+)
MQGAGRRSAQPSVQVHWDGDDPLRSAQSPGSDAAVRELRGQVAQCEQRCLLAEQVAVGLRGELAECRATAAALRREAAAREEQLARAHSELQERQAQDCKQAAEGLRRLESTLERRLREQREQREKSEDRWTAELRRELAAATERVIQQQAAHNKELESELAQVIRDYQELSRRMETNDRRTIDAAAKIEGLQKEVRRTARGADGRPLTGTWLGVLSAPIECLARGTLAIAFQFVDAVTALSLYRGLAGLAGWSVDRDWPRAAAEWHDKSPPHDRGRGGDRCSPADTGALQSPTAATSSFDRPEFSIGPRGHHSGNLLPSERLHDFFSESCPQGLL